MPLPSSPGASRGEQVNEQRYQAIETAQDAGCTNVQIARAAGISERGIYKLLERRRNKRG